MRIMLIMVNTPVEKLSFKRNKLFFPQSDHRGEKAVLMLFPWPPWSSSCSFPQLV